MSKNKLLAVAVAAALAAPTAYAASINEAGVTENSNQFLNNTSTYTVPVKTVVAVAADSYLGRTVGYNVRVTLSAGKIKVCPTVTATGGAQSATLVAGTCTVGGSNFLVNVVPAAGGTLPGEGFTIGTDPDGAGPGVATALQIDNLAALGAGGTLSLSGVVSDPTTGIPLPNSEFTKAVLTTQQGVAVSFTPAATPSVIDVGQPSAKKFFTTAGAAIGSGVVGNLFDAGVISITNATGVAAWLPGTGTADITITGANFAPFADDAAVSGVYLATDATCATKIGANGTIAADGKSATFTAVVLSTLSGAAPFDANVCFNGDGATQIAAQDIKGSAVVKPGAAFLNYSSPVGNLASMEYNGPVVRVHHFNPAANAAQESYLRISNTSGIGGLVSIEGTCDNGVASTTPVSFNLDAGKSLLVTSKDLEQGNAAKGLANGLGACTPAGKYRLVVTGEFSTMAVQNFLRNNTSAGLINTNVNNNDDDNQN